MLEELCIALDEAGFFKQYYFYETASRIEALATAVNNKKLSSKEIIEEVFSIIEVFTNEFTNIIPDGRQYRKRCYVQTQQIALKAYLLINKNRMDLPNEFEQFKNRIEQTDGTINPMAQLLAALRTKPNRTNAENSIMFSSACYIYNQALEGIFSQVVKQIYGLLCLSEAKPPQYLENDTSFIWNFYRNCEKDFKLKPVILEGWYEKSSIRNAIAHSQVSYDSSIDLVQLYAKNSNTGQIYDKRMSFREFFNIWIEVGDAIDSFRYSTRMLLVLNALIEADEKLKNNNT